MQVEDIVANALQTIHMIELDKIKLPFASKHCLQSSYISLAKQTLKRENKKDDKYIQRAQRLEFDEEPGPPGLDTYGETIKCDRMVSIIPKY